MSPSPSATDARRGPAALAAQLDKSALAAQLDKSALAAQLDKSALAAQLDKSALAAQLGKSTLPPVHLWNPAHCGDSEMRIAADGTWFHQGSPIGRKELVKLFSTILRREPDGSHVLVTPVERLDIAVDDAPFVAVEAIVEGSGSERCILFRLNTDDSVACGPENALCIETAADGTPRPYLHVRAGLRALVNRAVFYQLADLALDEATRGAETPGLWSGGGFFPFAPA